MCIVCHALHLSYLNTPAPWYLKQLQGVVSLSVASSDTHPTQKQAPPVDSTHPDHPPHGPNDGPVQRTFLLPPGGQDCFPQSSGSVHPNPQLRASPKKQHTAGKSAVARSVETCQRLGGLRS